MSELPPNSPRADSGVRVLDVANPEDVRREIARVGSDQDDVRMLAPNAVYRLVKLQRVAARPAGALVRVMLAVGGNAAVHPGIAGNQAEFSDVLLMGTLAQFETLCGRLQSVDMGLPASAGAIRQALTQYDTVGGVLRCGPFTLPLGEKTYIMGILNVTPDSFSGDGLQGSVDAALWRAERMVEDGAQILDVGGESTRPGAEPVALDEELRRVAPVVKAVTERFAVPVSVDTYKSAVARAAVEAGAVIINDISGLRFDPEMAGLAGAARVPVVVMHIKGTPRTMQQHSEYEDLMGEVCAYLQESTDIAAAAGLARDQVILDPGFGFGKTMVHNLELVRRLRELRSYGQPVLLGPSRKSTIGRILGDLPSDERVEGTGAMVSLAIANGADIVRVHDVKEMARVAKVTDAVARGWRGHG